MSLVSRKPALVNNPTQNVLVNAHVSDGAGLLPLFSTFVVHFSDVSEFVGNLKLKR